MSVDLDRMLQVADDVVARAQKRGASVAECVVHDSAHLSAKVRLGDPELVEEAGSRSIGLRVMLGQKVAVTYTSDMSPAGLQRLLEDSFELAELSEPDSFAGPAEPA